MSLIAANQREVDGCVMTCRESEIDAGVERAGFTLVELMVALLGPTLKGSHKKIVGPWFGSRPDAQNYTWDRGTFSQLLPFMESQSQADLLNQYAFSVSPQNAKAIQTVPSILRCPSCGDPSRLTRLSAGFGRPEIDGLESKTCDYSGNGGYHDPAMSNFSLTIGPVLGQMPGVQPSVGVQSIVDGLSNTLLFWDSAGDRLHRAQSPVPLDFDLDAPESIRMIFDPARSIFFTSNHRGSTKAYLYCWAGMRSGTVQAFSEYNVIGSPGSDSRYHRTINVANDVGQPFSRHTGGVNVIFADGSLRFISTDTSALIIFAMVSRAGGETP